MSQDLLISFLSKLFWDVLLEDRGEKARKRNRYDPRKSKSQKESEKMRIKAIQWA